MGLYHELSKQHAAYIHAGGVTIHLTPLTPSPSAGFAQWKDIMQLLLGCEEAPLRTRTPLYVSFLAALRAQLRHSFGQARQCWH